MRAPANHCALVGLRPTHGRISLEGVLDLAPSFDTCGWFARDVPTFARVADVLLGSDPSPLPDDRVRLLAPTDVWGLLAPEVLEAQRAPRDRVEAVLGRATAVEVVLDGFEPMYWSFRYLLGREAWRSDGALIDRFAPPLGPGVAQRFAWARDVTDAQVAEATAFRARFRAHMTRLLGSDGVPLMRADLTLRLVRCVWPAIARLYRGAVRGHCAPTRRTRGRACIRDLCKSGETGTRDGDCAARSSPAFFDTFC